MHEREKSDPAIRAGKPTNKADATPVADAAEAVEQRSGAKGNASEQSTHRTQGREQCASGSIKSERRVCIVWVAFEPQSLSGFNEVSSGSNHPLIKRFAPSPDRARRPPSGACPDDTCTGSRNGNRAQGQRRQLGALRGNMPRASALSAPHNLQERLGCAGVEPSRTELLSQHDTWRC